MSDKGVAVNGGGEAIVTVIPRGVTDVVLSVHRAGEGVRVVVTPEAASILCDFLAEWLSSFEGPEATV